MFDDYDVIADVPVPFLAPYIYRAYGNGTKVINTVRNVTQWTERRASWDAQEHLNDTSPMVLGSAVTAFAEVCPQNWAIFHPNYRKLCQLLVLCRVPSRDFIAIGATVAWRRVASRRWRGAPAARARAPSNHDTRRRPTATSGRRSRY